MPCLDLSKQKFKINAKDSLSSSIVLFLKTKSNPKVDAALKITTESLPDNNMLEVERELYDMIKKKVSLWTPHVLSAIDTGKCRDTEVLQMKNSKNAWERDLYKEWIALRTESIEKKLAYENKSWPSFLKTLPASVDKKDMFAVGTYLHEKHSRWKREFRDMYYVTTPLLKGKRLDDFLMAKKTFSDDMVRMIALQLSQALSILALHKIVHNDLHFANVYIETFSKPITISYTYPKKCSIQSKFKIMIFDFDRGYAEGGTINTGLETTALCEKYGECSNFVAKRDWYEVLTKLIYHTENEHIIEVMKGMYEEDFDKPVVGKDAAQGKPCVCEKITKKGRKVRCARCFPKSLSKIITPRTYFLREIGNF